MKKAGYIYMVVLMFATIPATSFSDSGNVEQGSVSFEPTQAECVKFMHEFLKWYTSFAVRDDSIRRVVKLVRLNGREVYRIDSLGVEEDVNRCVQSGFFTKSWKDHIIKNLLAADKTLSKMNTSNVVAFGDIGVPGLIGDPILSLGSPKKWLQSGYKWHLKAFRRLRNAVTSVDLLLDSGWGPRDEWTIYLRADHGQLKIYRVSAVDQ